MYKRQLLDRSSHAAFAKISVIRLPRISNFTDFNALERLPGIALSYVSRPEELTGSDLIILPGTKNTMGDLKWLRQNGLEAVITRMAGKGIPVIGVCGGFQMLGTSLSDPHGVEAVSYTHLAGGICAVSWWRISGASCEGTFRE